MSPLFPNSSPRAADRRLPEDRQPQPVVGLRSWKLRRTADGVALQSLFRNECWGIGITTASCHVWPTGDRRLARVPVKTLTVGQAARRSGVLPKAVRLYEAKGLLSPAPRSESGYRTYAPDDVEVLRFIRQAKLLGLTL